MFKAPTETTPTNPVTRVDKSMLIINKTDEYFKESTKTANYSLTTLPLSIDLVTLLSNRVSTGMSFPSSLHLYSICSQKQKNSKKTLQFHIHSTRPADELVLRSFT